MKSKKYIPLVVAIIFAIILVPFMTGGDDGRYIVSYEEIEPVDYYKPTKVKLYVENSGSMDGYMFNGSELKDAVYSYVSGLSTHSDTTELYFVNSGVYRINSSYRMSFMKCLLMRFVILQEAGLILIKQTFSLWFFPK